MTFVQVNYALKFVPHEFVLTGIQLAAALIAEHSSKSHRMYHRNTIVQQHIICASYFDDAAGAVSASGAAPSEKKSV